MIDLTPYLNILGLPPDATWDQVEQRYRTLVIFWHPDRVSSPHHKGLAEEELKKINNAKDKLKQHWRDWQNRSRSSDSQAQGSSSHGSNAHDEKAKQKERERKRSTDETRWRREAENRRREEKRQKQQEDFDAVYEQYSSSRQYNENREVKRQQLGQRLLRCAVTISAGLLILGISSDALLKRWITSLRHSEEPWLLSRRNKELQNQDHKDEHLRCPGDSILSPFALPMPPPPQKE